MTPASEPPDHAAAPGRQAAAAAAGVRKSAERLERSAGVVENSADRRTALAADRTVFAAERTYAAWVRTGLGALASGVGARALFAKILPSWFGQATGTLLILFSVFCFLCAVWREFTPGITRPRPHAPRLPAPLLLIVNGALVVVDIAAIAGIWLAQP